MAFFPTSPTNGQQANVGNITYQWSNTSNTWNRVGTTVTQLVDGITVNITGNINATGTGQHSFYGRISSGGNITATGNLYGANFSTPGIVNIGGNLIAGNLASNNTITTSLLTALTQIAVGTSYMQPGVISSADINASNAISASYISASTTVSGNLVSTSLVTNTGNFSGTITGSGGATITGNVQVGNLTVTSNASHGNLNVTGAVTASGNITGSYILGNGAFLTGVTTGGGGGGGGTRSNVTVGTGTIANAATTTTNALMSKGYAIYKIATSAAAWVRVYTSTTTMAADSGRAITTDPQPGSGVIAEAITTGANVVLMSPATIGFNDNATVNNLIPVSITNLSGASTNVQVTFTYIGLES